MTDQLNRNGYVVKSKTVSIAYECPSCLAGLCVCACVLRAYEASVEHAGSVVMRGDVAMTKRSYKHDEGEL
jgi:predicted transporter